jgi:hypothetical protein
MNKLIGLIICIALLSCNSKEKVSEGILPDSTMKSILIDISIVDASYNVSASSPQAPKFKAELFYEQVMKDHHTTRAEFNRSMAYYSQNTKQLQKIYEDALVDLSKRQMESNRK